MVSNSVMIIIINSFETNCARVVIVRLGQVSSQLSYYIGVCWTCVTSNVPLLRTFTIQFMCFSDANKRLHDTNDDLREAVEVARRTSPVRQQSVAVSFELTMLQGLNGHV